jgi:uncharacterized damage-inducible protein DinB
MTGLPLSHAVEQFASLIQKCTDTQLAIPWAWQSYDSEGIRFSVFRTYEELHELAVKLRSERTLKQIPASSAQQILALYHAAYCDLQGAMVGLSEEQLEKVPAEGEWSVKQTLAHIIQADLGFYVAIRFALDSCRTGETQPAKITRELWVSKSGIDREAFTGIAEGPYNQLKEFHARTHQRILSEYSGITEAEVDLPSVYWENEAMSLRFRLQRFDSHMRQHTIQIDKTLAALGFAPNEGKRLARLLYAGLADVDDAVLGADEIGKRNREDLAKLIVDRATEISGLIQRATSS